MGVKVQFSPPKFRAYRQGPYRVNFARFFTCFELLQESHRKNSQALRIIPQQLVWRRWVSFMTYYLVGFAESSSVPPAVLVPKAKLRLLPDSSSCFGNSASLGCGYFRKRTQSTMSCPQETRDNT
jgi:hypothetical protein